MTGDAPEDPTTRIVGQIEPGGERHVPAGEVYAALADLITPAAVPFPGWDAAPAGEFPAALQSAVDHVKSTAYDTPEDPIADLRAACDRITAAHRPAPSTPLEFDVPALAGHVVHRAGPDVALDDQAAFQSHAFALPPRGWSSGWVAHPSTLDAAPRRERAPLWAPPGMGGLIDLPVWVSDAAPVGVLVPVYIRAAQEAGGGE